MILLVEIVGLKLVKIGTIGPTQIIPPKKNLRPTQIYKRCAFKKAVNNQVESKTQEENDSICL